MKKYRKIMIAFISLFCFMSIFSLNIYAESKYVNLSNPKISSIKMSSNTSVKVTWNKVKNAKTYEIYTSINNGNYKRIKITQSNSYIQNNLKPGCIYSYKIRAVNGNQKSKFSVVKKAKTLAVTNPKLTLSVVGTTVTLRWNKVKNATGYMIYQKNSGRYFKQDTISGCVYKINNLELSSTYTFKIIPYIKTNEKVFKGTISEKSVKTSNTGYLLDLIKPYQKPYWFIDYNNTLFTMGGIDYTHGFTTMGYGSYNVGNETYFNLQGDYTELTFVSGICDNSNNFFDAVVYIYEDGKLVLSYDIDKNELPKKYTVNVKDCMQLRICVYNGQSTAFYGCHYGFGDIKLAK